jgi:hypothetical protein
MVAAALRQDPMTLPWRDRLTLASRRFNAWWEGYGFNADEERAALAATVRAQAPEIPAQDLVASAIWGDGRLDPGDASWTMRHARTLGVGLRARVAVLGAGVAGSLRDLKTGTQWRVSGYSRSPEQAKGLRIFPYETAMSRIARGAAEGGLCFFELHRDPDPAMIALFAAELVKPAAPFCFVDFAAARRGARLKSCFEAPWTGSLRTADQLAEILDHAGFRVADMTDETRAFLPLITRGWSKWKSAYAKAGAVPGAAGRAAHVAMLGRYAHLWAERFDALKAGQLQVIRFQARRKG